MMAAVDVTTINPASVRGIRLYKRARNSSKSNPAAWKKPTTLSCGKCWSCLYNHVRCIHCNVYRGHCVVCATKRLSSLAVPLCVRALLDLKHHHCTCLSKSKIGRCESPWDCRDLEFWNSFGYVPPSTLPLGLRVMGGSDWRAENTVTRAARGVAARWKEHLVETGYDRSAAAVDFDSAASCSGFGSGAGADSKPVLTTPFCTNCGVCHIKGDPDLGIPEWPCSAARIASSVAEPRSVSAWPTPEGFHKLITVAAQLQYAMLDSAKKEGYGDDSASHYLAASPPNQYYGAGMVQGLLVEVRSLTHSVTGKVYDDEYMVYSPAGEHRSIKYSWQSGSGPYPERLYNDALATLVGQGRLVLELMPSTRHCQRYQVRMFDGVEVPPVMKRTTVDGKLPLSFGENQLIWASATLNIGCPLEPWTYKEIQSISARALQSTEDQPDWAKPMVRHVASATKADVMDSDLVAPCGDEYCTSCKKFGEERAAAAEALSKATEALDFLAKLDDC